MIIPEYVTQYGFVLDGIGAHSSRTIMLEEIRMLLEACPMEALEDEYHAAIVDENALMKRTESTRRESFRRLRELYGISPKIPIFRVMRTLWPYSKDAQPVLAMA